MPTEQSLYNLVPLTSKAESRESPLVQACLRASLLARYVEIIFLPASVSPFPSTAPEWKAAPWGKNHRLILKRAITAVNSG